MRPMPVIITGWRTPGKSEATTGVPQDIDSTCTIPNDSVQLVLGKTVSSHCW